MVTGGRSNPGELLTSGGQKDLNSVCVLERKKERAFNFSIKGAEEEASGMMPLVFHCGPGRGNGCSLYFIIAFRAQNKQGIVGGQNHRSH